MGVNGVAPVDNRGPLVSMNVAGSGYIIDLRSDAEQPAPPTAEDRIALEKSSASAVLLGSYQSAPMTEATIERLKE